VSIWAAIAVTATLIALFFVPVDFALSAGTESGVRFRAHWLFGLVRLGGRSPAARRRLRPGRRRTRRARRERPGTGRRLIAIDGLPIRTARLVSDLLGALRWLGGSIALRGGLGDPADTGELCGAVACLRTWLPPSVMRVEFEPDFSGTEFEAEVRGACRVTPAQVVGPLLSFALSRPGRRAIGVLVWARAR
jgi:hypothetical protein